ncbi:MAG: hypothetical protein IPP78_12110 [Holophagaceae bacterium]|nr:hypothetical protein [Holophagaceae bacterium]
MRPRILVRAIQKYGTGWAAAFVLALAPIICFAPLAAAGPEPKIVLTGIPDSSPHYFKMTTKVIHIEPDGQRKSREVYTLWLQVTPKPRPERDIVTSHRFTVRNGSGPEVSIPALKGWSYALPTSPTWADDRGQLFGIDHSRFESLVDEKGASLSTNTYLVFNAFVDFHSFCHVFCGRIPGVEGIQDLHESGDRIVHIGSHVEAPVHLASLVEKGSTFKNGEITLELKGTGQVDGARCAIVGYDSGESSLHMILKPTPQAAMDVVGGSHYWGDLYVDLATQWVRKATLSELVVSEMSGALLKEKMHVVIERAILLEAISKDRCEGGK